MFDVSCLRRRKIWHRVSTSIQRQDTSDFSIDAVARHVQYFRTPYVACSGTVAKLSRSCTVTFSETLVNIVSKFAVKFSLKVDDTRAFGWRDRKIARKKRIASVIAHERLNSCRDLSVQFILYVPRLLLTFGPRPAEQSLSPKKSYPGRKSNFSVPATESCPHALLRNKVWDWNQATKNCLF